MDAATTSNYPQRILALVSFAENADGMVMSEANLVCSQMPAPVLVVERSSVSALSKQAEAEAEAKPMRDIIELQCSEHAFRRTPWGHPSLLHPAIGIQCDDDPKGFLGEWRQWRRAPYVDSVPKPRWPSLSVAPLLWSSLQRHHRRHRRRTRWRVSAVHRRSRRREM